MEKRKIIQKEATDSIIENRFRGIIHCSPRLGKTKIAIDALNKVKVELKVLILAPLLPILDSWKSEVEKWGLIDNVKIDYCWSNSIKKIQEHYDLIIADEIHCYNKNVLIKLLQKQIKGSRILGLSGTLNEPNLKSLNSILKLQLIYEYTFEEAIKDGIIADYEIICIPCQLDDTEKYIVSGGKEKKFLQTEKDAYNYFTTRYEKLIEEGKFLFTKSVIQKRTEIIYKSISKLQKTKEVLSTIDDRVLIFTGRSSIADELGPSFHSKSKRNLDIFVAGAVNSLSVVSMISMGVTIPNLKIAVFNQVKSNDSLFIQQSLRTMNLENDKKATIYAIYLKGTQDEEWLKSAISGFNKDKILWK